MSKGRADKRQVYMDADTWEVADALAEEDPGVSFSEHVRRGLRMVLRDIRERESTNPTRSSVAESLRALARDLDGM